MGKFGRSKSAIDNRVKSRFNLDICVHTHTQPCFPNTTRSLLGLSHAGRVIRVDFEFIHEETLVGTSKMGCPFLAQDTLVGILPKKRYHEKNV